MDDNIIELEAEATMSPRQYAAALIQHCITEKGWTGEHVLQRLEKMTLMFSTEERKFVFFRDVREEQEGAL